MKRTVYTWMLTLLTVFGATVASADEKVSFEVKAPMVVAKGEAVRATPLPTKVPSRPRRSRGST